MAVTLVVVPLWTNLLVRTYAWQILLAPEGWLSQLAATLRMVPPGTPLYPGPFAVALGMLCDFLPFMVLPLYASLEKLDWSIVDAAADLGASPVQSLWHALLPQVRPGLIAGSLLVFLPATAQFVIPDLLGGAKTALLGSAIQQQFGSSRDWPFGCAIATSALLLVIRRRRSWPNWNSSRTSVPTPGFTTKSGRKSRPGDPLAGRLPAFLDLVFPRLRRHANCASRWRFEA